MAPEERVAQQRARSRRYDQSEKGQQHAAAWRSANAAHIKQQGHEHYEQQAQQVKDRAAQWAAANPEQRRAIQRAWKAAHPEQTRESVQQRRARKRDAFVAPVDRRAIYERDGGLCGLCGEPVAYDDYHIDHIRPLARGGTHEPANVQIAHPLCNLKKQARYDVEASA